MEGTNEDTTTQDGTAPSAPPANNDSSQTPVTNTTKEGKTILNICKKKKIGEVCGLKILNKFGTEYYYIKIGELNHFDSLAGS